MKEQVSKYMIQNARVFFVSLSQAVDRSAELNGLSGADKDLLGRLEAFACCIAALQKVEKASVTVRAVLPEGCFSAVADREGIVRGRKEEKEISGQASLEVTLHLPLRGNYTGVVTGTDFDSLAEGYFARSLQIASVCKVFRAGEQSVCVAVEKLPGEDCDLAGICRCACESLPEGRVPGGFEFLEASDLRFGCTCSRGALLRIVTAMPPEDRQELAEDGKIVTYCNACGKRYTFEV